MKVLAALVLGFVLFAAAPALAHDVDGKWAGMVSTPMGDVPVAFEFKADGAKLTGSTTGPDGAQVPIKDGAVEGSNISFGVTLDFGGMPLTINYKGAVAKDQIKLTLDIMGMPMDLVVKKAA